MSYLFGGFNPANEAQRGAYVKPATTEIKRLRIASGMTQPICAKHCRVSLRTFQRAESGDVVPFVVKRAIERALGALW